MRQSLKALAYQQTHMYMSNHNHATHRAHATQATTLLSPHQSLRKDHLLKRGIKSNDASAHARVCS